MPLPSPSRFGRYVVLDVLTGDPGETTLLAFDPELDRKVGLKVFDPSFDGGKDARRRDKARVLAGLVHPHVVKVHDVGLHEGQLYIAMDFVAGGTLLAWIAKAAPSWRRRVEVLIAAGEGLLAAHAAGLVHGGFTAHTIVVGDDGQIRVVDFVRSRANRHGRQPDVQRDLIDFSATLYRALWDRSPWDDEGRPQPPPSDSPVPRRVRRAIMDGLRPEGRPLDLRALLEDLRAALSRRRFAWVGAATLVTAAGLVGALEGPNPEPSRPWCDGIDARVSEVWNQDISERAREAFIATGAPYAAEAWDDVSEDVTVFVQSWREAEAHDCERRARPQPVDDAVALCLHRQYQGLRALVGMLQQADRDVVASAARTAASLGSPAACEDATLELPYEPGTMAAAMAIQSVLSAARVQHELGRFAEAVTTAEHAREQATELGVRSLVAESDYQVAMARRGMGRETDAERGYHMAFSGAVAAGHDEIVVRAAMELSWLLAEQGRDEEAKVWAHHAAAAIEQHDTPELRTRLAAVRGKGAFHRGDCASARGFYEESRELAERSDPPDAFAKMHAMQVVAVCVGNLGDTQGAIERLREGLAYVESELGTRHPNVGHYRNSLASELSDRGDVVHAIAEAERAQAIFREALGPDHWATIANRLNLSATLHAAGRGDEADAGYREALAAGRRTLPPEDSRYATLLGNVGMHYSLTGRLVEAAALLSEAATRQEAAHGPDHPHTLGFLNNLAATYMYDGRDEEAAEAYRDLLRRTGRAMGEDHPQLVPALLGLATVAHRMGQSQDAVTQLERAIAITTARGDRPERIGRVQLTLAEVLWAAEIDRDRALQAARAAEQSWVAADVGGWDVTDELAEVRAWLQARSRR